MKENFFHRPATPGEWLADAVRVIAVLSVVVAAIRYSPTDAGVIAFALPGVFLPRLLAAAPWFDIAVSLSVLVAAWSNVLGLYRSVAWWDLAVHLVCTGALAATALLLLAHAGVVATPGAGAPPAGTMLMTGVLGLALGAVWEMVEWAGYTFVSDEIFVAYADTIGDMAVGGLGAVGAGVVIIGGRAYARRSMHGA